LISEVSIRATANCVPLYVDLPHHTEFDRTRRTRTPISDVTQHVGEHRPPRAVGDRADEIVDLAKAILVAMGVTIRAATVSLLVFCAIYAFTCGFRLAWERVMNVLLSAPRASSTVAAGPPRRGYSSTAGPKSPLDPAARHIDPPAQPDDPHHSAATSIRFGAFCLWPVQRLLLQDDQPVHIGSRALDILIALLERPGDLVPKEELMARVWPNTFVEPANLTVHVAALRRALGDCRDGNRFLINIPGRGQLRKCAPGQRKAGLIDYSHRGAQYNLILIFRGAAKSSAIDGPRQLRRRALADTSV
jgi:Transcriptional regulatory protein, C terminal